MSQSVRQSNLFAAEDFKNVYRTFQNVDFRAYDYDSLREALFDNIREQYPEDFNDYIESSEFVALVDTLAILGTSLAFRTDINSRENSLDTAERRESLIRLARWINYQPRRNIPANGLFKLQGVETSEPITDGAGRRINNTTIFWNDPNNPDSFEQFITILNAAFSTQTQFGRPLKRQNIGGIPTELYQMENVKNLNVVYPLQISTDQQTLPFDVVNPDIDDTLNVIEERHPDPSDAFHMIYRNDGQGLGSDNTGFFLHFKQGSLERTDRRIDIPVPNRIIDVDVENINESDVYVQEIEDTGDVIDKWTRVPSLIGNNVIFNSIDIGQRDIFQTISRTNDQISVKFSDGNFGNLPTGTFRIWHRISANRRFTLRPQNVRGESITIPYISKSGQQHQIRLVFSLEQTIGNAQPSETNEQIRERAPQVYYTQNRMVNNEDYNVFPLTRGNEIVKLRAINRTHAGHSRFIDINDPTGRHQNVNLLGEDGAVYKDQNRFREEVETSVIDTNPDTFVQNTLERITRNNYLKTFYYETYIDAYETRNMGAFDFREASSQGEDIFWKTLPEQKRNNTGYFTTDVQSPLQGVINTTTSVFDFLKPGAKLKFAASDQSDDYVIVGVNSIDGFGVPQTGSPDEIGPVELTSEIEDTWQLISIIPPIRTSFEPEEIDDITDQFDNNISVFGLGYDLELDEWYVMQESDMDLQADFTLGVENDVRPINEVPESWLVKFELVSTQDDNYYEIITRGERYIFESLNNIRFFFDPEDRAFDLERGRFIDDEILFLDINNAPSLVETWEYESGEWTLVSRSDGQFITVSYDNDIIVMPSRTLEEDDVRVKVFYQPSSTVEEEFITVDNTVLSNGILQINDAIVNAGIDINDVVKVEIYYVGKTKKLENEIVWNISSNIVQEDGYTDTRKVEVMPKDTNRDGVADDPLSFRSFVNVRTDRVYLERFIDFDELEYFRPWVTGWIDLQGETIDNSTVSTPGQLQSYTLLGNDLIIVDDEAHLQEIVDEVNNITFDGPGGDKSLIIKELESKIILLDDVEEFKRFVFREIIDSQTGGIVDIVLEFVNDKDHKIKVGRSFTLDRNNNFPENLYFRWRHFAPRNSRIDPSISNIIDMFVLTQSYLRDVEVWKEEGNPLEEFPEPPTTENLRIQFSEIEEFKSLSDQIIWRPAKIRPLFGRRSDEELRATFKVVKVPGSSATDNEIKSRVIEAVDSFFDVNNFDFGDSFFYSELAAFIHQQLPTIIGSVVVVPKNNSSNFGDLFQVKAQSDELFISTATVADVDIVRSLTEKNLRIGN